MKQILKQMLQKIKKIPLWVKILLILLFVFLIFSKTIEVTFWSLGETKKVTSFFGWEWLKITTKHGLKQIYLFGFLIYDELNNEYTADLSGLDEKIKNVPENLHTYDENLKHALDVQKEFLEKQKGVKK